MDARACDHLMMEEQDARVGTLLFATFYRSPETSRVLAFVFTIIHSFAL